LGTTLLKGDKRRHVLLKGGDMSYLTDETWRRHVLVVCIKWQNGTYRHTDISTHRHIDTLAYWQMKKGPRRPSPLGRGVKIMCNNNERTIYCRYRRREQSYCQSILPSGPDPGHQKERPAKKNHFRYKVVSSSTKTWNNNLLPSFPFVIRMIAFIWLRQWKVSFCHSLLHENPSLSQSNANNHVGMLTWRRNVPWSWQLNVP
jgi:hypothetical protein